MIKDKKTTYLAYIQNSVGSKIFKNVYFKVGKHNKDIVNNGELSCAIYVSSILYLLDLIDGPHATVKTTIRKLLENRWGEVKSPQRGDILVWQKKKDHEHIGFYLNNKVAISNSSFKNGRIIKHHPTYNNKRVIKNIFRYKNF